ncbi:Zn(II)2Cys6 transcription factor domain-containing protein [Aspergillus undulatus]|uniref:Zn(II)2Cys6 transcription factor domain-containing protein n=1 Tax=Aspergillus undulatus TaxID=1810928 RepID=UPI003CCCAFA2
MRSVPLMITSRLSSPVPLFPKNVTSVMKSSNSSIRRTRSGCWNCKRQRRRCDENKPSCGACKKRGWPRHYGIRLLWEHEAESMGITFSRANTKAKDRGCKQKRKRSHFLFPTQSRAFRYWLHTTSDDIRCLYEEFGHGPRGMFYEAEMNQLFPVARLPVRDTIILFSLVDCPSMAEADRFLFYYCAPVTS